MKTLTFQVAGDASRVEFTEMLDEIKFEYDVTGPHAGTYKEHKLAEVPLSELTPMEIPVVKFEYWLFLTKPKNQIQEKVLMRLFSEVEEFNQPLIESWVPPTFNEEAVSLDIPPK